MPSSLVGAELTLERNHIRVYSHSLAIKVRNYSCGTRLFYNRIGGFMADGIIADGYKVVYLIVEVGSNGNKKSFWRPAGRAYPCRDGSLNLKLDIHPGLTFNIRDPKSNSEREEVEHSFVCNDCTCTFNDEEAHAVNTGGAVCNQCSKEYKDCPKCDYCFPKTVRGSVCPKCKMEGK